MVDIVVDFSANKLRQGYGENALYVLDSLADLALIHINFQWQRMIPPPTEDEDVDIDKDDEDPETDNEDSEPDWADDDDDPEIVDLAVPSTTEQPIQTILHSDIDANLWKTEVERVTPMLKVVIRQDAKDWRMHLEQISSFQKTIETSIKQTTPQLEKYYVDLQQSLERIDGREKSLNHQMSNVLAKFREAQDRRAEMKEKYKSASGGVTQRTETLQRISDDIEQLKQQIEEQGAKTSDGAPMVKIKQALAKMESDIDRMNVQIGVLEQGLLNAQLRDRVAFTTEAFSYM
ncbi:unnamed protein product [Auanema sp. JU1783]|nr:unnamed protein product [Auanema sp. JU1783]